MRHTRSVIAVSGLTLAAVHAHAGIAQPPVLGFEPTESISVVRNTPVTDQFETTHAMTFSVSDGTPLLFGDYGGEPDGWWTDLWTTDELHDQSGFGDFFVFYQGAPTPGRVLNVTFSVPTNTVGFSILDLDDGIRNMYRSAEAFDIRAIGSEGQALSTTQVWAGDEGTGDMAAYNFTASRDKFDIFGLEIEYVGRAQSPGFGFDNFFGPTPPVIVVDPGPETEPPVNDDTVPTVPTPGAVALLALGGTLAGRRRRC